jgi:uracil-DNA glycosylase
MACIRAAPTLRFVSVKSDYHHLLDATITHLEQLKSQGVKYIQVSPETVAALSKPATPAASGQRRRPRVKSPSVQAQLNRADVSAAKPSVTTSVDIPHAEIVPQKPLLPAAGFEAADPRMAAATFDSLRALAMECERCPHLASSRKNVVFGVGSVEADLMFVGEAPGADEDIQGEPFVGKAGQLLTRIIQTMGLSREQVFIANILKCRPDTPGQSAGNRKPTPEEMKTCLPYLIRQIDLIQPKVIVALGATAVEGLLGKTVGITRLRGHFQEFRGIPTMPTYHPAYLLRNQSLAAKREVWEDMLDVMEKLGMPISEKQRGFFLTSGK